MKTILSLVLSVILLGLAWFAFKVAMQIRATKDAAAAVAETTPAVNPPAQPQKPRKPAEAAAGHRGKQPAPLGKNPFVTDGSGRFSTYGAATEQVAAEVFDSCLDRPTLVVWLLDRTESATEMRKQVRAKLAEVYETLDQFQFGPAADSNVSEPWLTGAVASFAGTVEYLTPEPTADGAELAKAAGSFGEDSSGQQHTFAAIAEAVDHFAPKAEEQHRRLLMVVATDETGDDDQRVDDLVPVFRKQGIPLYVIGVAAPFGSRKSLGGLVQVEGLRPIRQGPESLEGEVLNLGGWQSQWQAIDSGFGPFALSRLAMTSGGRFLAVRTMNTYDPATMARYAPDYLSRAGYDALLQGNRARRALVDAARTSQIDLGARLETEFRKRDEASLKKDLDEAQRLAARLEPKLHALSTAIEAGLADSAQLVEPRWQAGYDLALGRVAAARARIEGYNTALAQLKGGRAFPDPSHTTWVLEPTNDVKGDSSLERLADRARKSLERVRKQHPDTPWATQAARELGTPMGWHWVSKR